jgi:GntR family transcriptional regulator/MocR family aminotransferase
MARRDALLGAIARELRGVLTVTAPPGGMTLWARVDDEVDLDAWRARALGRGVALAIGRDLHVDGRTRPFVRFAYARHDEAELVDAVRRMKRALRTD